MTVVNMNVVRGKNVNVAMGVSVPTAKHLLNQHHLNPASFSNAKCWEPARKKMENVVARMEKNQ